MIVVLGSRHDSVATALADAWPDASLCSAEDLATSGWRWLVPHQASRARWVVDGSPVPDAEVSGVFVRRTTIYPEELHAVHPDDRAYVAAEARSLLVSVLAATQAVVVNPIVDGAFGEELVQPDVWMPAAAAVGLPLAPLRISSRPRRPRRYHPVRIEVVGRETFGPIASRTRTHTIDLAEALGLRYLTAVFDGRHRLVSADDCGLSRARGARSTRLDARGLAVILVWGPADDPPTAQIVETLARRQVEHVHLDDRDLGAMEYEVELGPRATGTLELRDRVLELDDISGVYLRPGGVSGRAATTATALLAFIAASAATVVNPPAAGRSNGSKPFQLQLLAAAGLRVPQTIVTTDPADARCFLREHGRVVYKSLSGIRSIVAALESTDEHRFDAVGTGPVQLQRCIAGVDVRVHVVAEQWFATRIETEGTDYRYAARDGLVVDLEATQIPERLGRCLVALTKQMSLLFSGIDLRLTPNGEYYALEVNPSPGFTFFEDATGQPIGDAVADLLIHP